MKEGKRKATPRHKPLGEAYLDAPEERKQTRQKQRNRRDDDDEREEVRQAYLFARERGEGFMR